MVGTGDLGMGVTFVLYDKASETARAAGAAVTSLEQKVTRASESITQAGQRITSGLVAVTATAAMLVAPFAVAINEAAKFEFTIREAYAKGAAVNGDEVNKLREQAISLGQASMFNAQAVADAQVIMAQSGFRNYQIMQALPEVLDLATAGGLNLAKATLIASDTMFQFNMRATDFKKISDILTLGANESSQSVEDLAQALKYIGPTAKALNISLEETVAYTEMMAQAGMRGTLGARAFGTALTALAGGNKQVTAMLQEIGVDPFATKDRSFVGLSSLVRQLTRGLAGRTQEDTARILKRIFGAEAFQEINQLLHGEIEIAEGIFVRAADALDYYANHNKEAFGTASKTSKMMLDTLYGDMKLMSSAWSTTMITIGSQFESVLRPIVQWMTAFLRTVQAFVQTPLGKWLVISAAAAGVFLTALIAISTVMTVILPAIKSMVIAGYKLMIAYWPVYVVMGLIAGAVYLVSRAWEEFQNTLSTGEVHGGFVGQLERLGAVIYTLAEVWKTWNGSTFNLSQENVNALDKLGIKDFVLNLATWLVRIKEFWKGFADAFLEVVGPLMDSFGELKQSLVFLFSTLFGKEFAKAFGEIESWVLVGKIFGEMISISILGPITLLTKGITLLTSAFAGLITLMKGGWDYLKVGFAYMSGGMGAAAAQMELNRLASMPKNENVTYGAGDKQYKSMLSSQEIQDKLRELNARKAGATNEGPYSAEYLKQMMSEKEIKSDKPSIGPLKVELHIDGKKFHDELFDINKIQKSRE